jgi:hypothetical protein
MCYRSILIRANPWLAFLRKKENRAGWPGFLRRRVEMRLHHSAAQADAEFCTSGQPKIAICHRTRRRKHCRGKCNSKARVAINDRLMKWIQVYDMQSFVCLLADAVNVADTCTLIKMQKFAHPGKRQSQLPPTLHGLQHGDLVRVFDIAAHRNAHGNSRHP